MSLIAKTVKAPIPYEPERGDEVLAPFGELPENIRQLLKGVAGCSPYLRGLLEREADWLASVLAVESSKVLPALLAEVKGSTAETLGRDLRRTKRRLALYVALADTGGMWPLARVTGTLTDFADFAVGQSLMLFLRAEFQRGKLPGITETDLETAAGLVVLAMGKMGAGELNYSSDIDLIVLFDETRHCGANFDAIRERFIRITRRMAKLLGDVTGDGYVFRTDLRLRPDPSVTPVCLSMGAAERYYESLGRTWERAAYIKARPCAGDIRAGWAFLETLRPFVWRKHLDYAAIQDAHDMRLRIRDHKKLGGPLVLQGHNLKLGRGGIREIEFFTQTRQIIAGGRDPELRSRETIAGLGVLAAKGWVPRETADKLTQAYLAHREVEHRIQMLNDAQTHDLPNTPEQMDRLARFCGFPLTDDFLADLRQRLNDVHHLTEDFFAPDDQAQPDGPELSQSLQEMVDKWRSLPALRTSRAIRIFKRLQPVILAKVNATARPEETLIQFDGFLAGLPAGVQLFSLFEANPPLIDLLVDICGSAPGLAHYLSRNAQVFDAVIGGSFFQPLPDAADMAAGLQALMAPLDDYENTLNTARRWMKEIHFRIGVQHLKGMIDSIEAGGHYSALADAVLAAIAPAIEAEFARRHGPLPGRGAAIIGMGSLGAASLTATSDLDLIVIYDAMGQEASEGKRPLAVSTYFARLTQALVTALSSPMAEGRLYEVDMRLRPSGRMGPVATPFSGFRNYQLNEAWTWEHLALTRARPVAGNRHLMAEIEAFRHEVISLPHDRAKVVADVIAMRERLAAARDAARVSNPFETKQGEGRMLDIELLAQMAALLAQSPARGVQDQLQAGVALGLYTDKTCQAVQRAYIRLARVRQVGRLVTEGMLSPDAIGQGGCDLLLAETGAENIDDLGAILADERKMVEGVIAACLTAD